MTTASPTTNVLAQNPFFAMSTKIINVYSEAIRQNMKSLSVSSAKIIQEQTIKAWTNAAQSCSEALAQNAMQSQQKAIERIVEANQKAFGVLSWDFSPFKMQPIAGLSALFPAMPDALPAKSTSRRVKQLKK
ncbi:hypothetical protein [Herbaspirillum sp. ST 5-3]|uniref:hypothetical protein n=1 Tax=Oxalobacteraceae TaxID=75682 RepID=UPI0010A2FBA2|nr:hypothetical protein [Herbaspirillum sp. ST 5-3]